jgi:protein-S-isoprenylcysteine O-methyltransferase Ste14
MLTSLRCSASSKPSAPERDVIASRRETGGKWYRSDGVFGRKAEHNFGVARSDVPLSRASGSSAAGVLTAAYGIAAYAIFLVAFLYLIGFVADADFTVGSLHLVDKTIDRGGIGQGTLTVAAVIIDAALLALFGLQHSVMARPGFKRWWTRIVPPSAERSTYVLAASICLLVLFAAWHPITGNVWRVTAQPWRALLIATALAGWAIVLLSTFLIDHFDLFGLRQVFARLRRRRHAEHAFKTPSLYRVVRHPIYLGFLIAFWVTPAMTLGHLLFAGALTGYILLAVRFEERDLIRAFGEQYRDYRRRVPMVIPGLGGHS